LTNPRSISDDFGTPIRIGLNVSKHVRRSHHTRTTILHLVAIDGTFKTWSLNQDSRRFLCLPFNRIIARTWYKNPFPPDSRHPAHMIRVFPLSTLSPMSIPREVYLPDPLAQWPWPRTLNPHFAEVKPQSDAWVRGFEAIDSKSQKAFDSCNFGEL